MKLPMMTQGIAAAMALGMVTTASAAQLLPVGNNVFPMIDTLAAGPGVTVATLVSPNTPDDKGKFTAQVNTAVTKGNSFGANALTFWYQLTNVDQTPDGADLTGLSVPFVTPATVAVDQTIAGPWKSQVAVNTGGAVTFSFIFNPLPEQNLTGWQVIETPFVNYLQGWVGVMNGAGEDVVALVPGSQIPEPSTYAGLFALGLAGFAAYRRFRA